MGEEKKTLIILHICGISYTEQMRHFHLWNLKVQFQHGSAKELIMFIKTLPTTKMHSLLDWRKSSDCNAVTYRELLHGMWRSGCLGESRYIY